MRTTMLSLPLVMLFAIAPPALAEPAFGVAAGDQSRDHLLTPDGLALTLGAGTTDFLSKGTRRLTQGDVGVYGDLRATYGTRSYLGVEAAYTFSGRGLSSAQFGENAPAIFGSSLEGLARLNYPMHSGRWFYAPFVVGGLGWTAFFRTDEDAGDRKSINVHRTDHVGTVPVGAGFAVGYRVLRAEARFMYRPTYGESGIGAAADGSSNMQAWFAGLAAGLEF
jgi:hypothetical protein